MNRNCLSFTNTTAHYTRYFITLTSFAILRWSIVHSFWQKIHLAAKRFIAKFSQEL